MICPITTNVKKEARILRAHIEKGVVGIHQSCDIMMDQIRAIDNKRLTKKIGRLPAQLIESLKENLMILFDIEIASTH
ncbi:MAG: type II toxin-antitoxin system PemK/MazF family toxin [Desulfamplus sp.]|nr:type II toxin-antitoxin system PemK/MazF family toxin [Desulfamplus sp.]